MAGYGSQRRRRLNDAAGGLIQTQGWGGVPHPCRTRGTIRAAPPARAAAVGGSALAPPAPGSVTSGSALWAGPSQPRIRLAGMRVPSRHAARLRRARPGRHADLALPAAIAPNVANFAASVLLEDPCVRAPSAPSTVVPAPNWLRSRDIPGHAT